MPAVRTPSDSSDALSTGTVQWAASAPLIARYKGRAVAIPRRINHHQLISSIKKIFKPLAFVRHLNIRIYAQIPEFGDERIQITSHAWGDLVANLREVWIEVQEGNQQLNSPQPSANVSSDAEKLMVVKFAMTTGETHAFKCKPSTRCEKVLGALYRKARLHAHEYRPLYRSDRLKEDDTFLSLDFKDGDEIYMMREQRGGKPVIYLFPPAPLPVVNVRLSLVPTWSFSALHPPTPVECTKLHGGEGNTETVSWTVSAKPDGSLIDKETNLAVSYLFWEALTEHSQLSSPPISRPATPNAQPYFDPARASEWLTPGSSVVLSVDKILAYLDTALKALTLHTEARTSFITYWLPSLLKHSHVALRFLPQDAYEESAPMSVEPKPDVVTRIFMIFRGVSERDEKWDEARTRAGENVEDVWKGAVGIETEKALNSSLFRVLEWGGMEVVY